MNGRYLPSTNARKLELPESNRGDGDAFGAPAAVVAKIRDFRGNQSCRIQLFDALTGVVLDFKGRTPTADTVSLDPGGRSTVYIRLDDCAAQVSSGPT